MSNINEQRDNKKLIEQMLATAAGDKPTEAKTEAPLICKNSIKLKDKVYKIEPLNGEDGLDLWEYILQRILPSVGTGLDAMQQEDDFLESTTFTEAMMHLSNKLEGSTFSMISNSLFAEGTVDGEPLDIKEHFKAEYGVWRKVFAHALKVNFSSFFEEGWSAGLKDLMAMVSPQLTRSPQESV